jgi:OmpA-OmpF porin, OOP family
MKPIRLLHLAFVVLLLSATLRASALDRFPDYFTVPAEITPNVDTFEQLDYVDNEFKLPDNQTITPIGKRWYAYINDPAGSGHADGPAQYQWTKAALIAGGWQERFARDDRCYGTFELQRAGVHAWAEISMPGQDGGRFVVLEVKPQDVVIALKPPAAIPETISPHADFPFLSHYPGSTLGDDGDFNTPLQVPMPNDEIKIVGTGNRSRFYATPKGLSALQFVSVYKAALIQAGWSLPFVDSSRITAHYADNGRDLWVHLYYASDFLRYYMADVGVQEAPDALSTQLQSACRVPLYGIEFDFNQSTIKPESNPTLERVAAALKNHTALKVEVQGHTDDVGDDAYNLKLSDARAASVVQWLLAHGIGAERLSAKGYGETQPVDDNGSAEGRARNRRVELKRPDCVAH